MRSIKKTGLILIVFLAALSFAASVSAASNAVIDFSGLAEGAIVSSVSSGNGISGDVIAGSVQVYGVNPRLSGNQAMIFDATCDGGCTGDDADLHIPVLGNVLIVSEDGDSSDPNDADISGARLRFDFSGFGPTGQVTINSIDVADVESEEDGGHIDVYSGGPGGTLLNSVAIPTTGDNQFATLVIGNSAVDYMEVVLNGSGAIDNINISADTPPPPPGGGEGCTPGYWKQNQHLDSWVTYSPSDDYETVFGVDASFTETLLGTLKQGGGGEKALGRHAVAALLNAANPDVSFEYTTAEVIQMVQDAYASSDFEGVKNLFEAQNELGCPLN